MKAWIALVLGLVLGAGTASAEGKFSYTRDVKPILERHCVVCHACYDAPCQLKMESAEGLDRGATKAVVYKAGVTTRPTTRLGIDAASTAEWRQKGFFSVIEGGPESLLYRMIELGRKGAAKANTPIDGAVVMGLARVNDCPTQAEFDKYQHRRMHEGMPFGMAPLKPADLDTLQGWLAEGAPMDAAPPRAMDGLTGQWEAYLNRPELKSKVIARYLYEHVFLAHLTLDGTGGQFYELVRSSTGPGSPIRVIATRRPSDDPGGPCYYRLRPVSGAIVQKTHVVYPFGADRLARYKQLFDTEDWKATAMPPFGHEASCNPFETFQEIPALARYQFMLDTAQYYVNSFIRGPVCLGNVATSVIDDHFFAMFQSPAHDKFVNDPEHAKECIPSLALDGDDGSFLDPRPDWLRANLKYGKARLAAYTSDAGATLDDLWDGDGGTNPDALLTIFRSYDSSTVLRGLRGQTPKTVWVMDYPLLERIYYLLVVNFDVFGRADHQITTRSYFDLMRVESEVNFLRWLPKAVRKPLYTSWYRGTVAALKARTMYPAVDDKSGPDGDAAGDPKADFLARVQARTPGIAGAPGELSGLNPPALDAALAGGDGARIEAALRPLATGTAAANPFIKQLPELTFLRIGSGDPATDRAYTLFRNRAHTNVAFMFKEEGRLAPDEDDLTLIRGPAGCYPNFIFQVPLASVEEFATSLRAVASAADFAALVNRFGVRRTHPAFWDAFQFFTQYQTRSNPLERGIFDANRYENY